MRFHHLGVAGESIKQLKEWVSRCFQIVQESEVVEDPLQRASLQMLTTAQGLHIELIEGPMVKSIISRCANLYHWCFEVEDIEQAAAVLVERGAIVTRPPLPAILFEGRRVAFVHTPMGLVELLEGPR